MRRASNFVAHTHWILRNPRVGEPQIVALNKYREGLRSERGDEAGDEYEDLLMADYHGLRNVGLRLSLRGSSGAPIRTPAGSADQGGGLDAPLPVAGTGSAMRAGCGFCHLFQRSSWVAQVTHWKYTPAIRKLSIR